MNEFFINHLQEMYKKFKNGNIREQLDVIIQCEQILNNVIEYSKNKVIVNEAKEMLPEIQEMIKDYKNKLN